MNWEKQHACSCVCCGSLDHCMPSMPSICDIHNDVLLSLIISNPKSQNIKTTQNPFYFSTMVETFCYLSHFNAKLRKMHCTNLEDSRGHTMSHTLVDRVRKPLEAPLFQERQEGIFKH